MPCFVSRTFWAPHQPAITSFAWPVWISAWFSIESFIVLVYAINFRSIMIWEIHFDEVAGVSLISLHNTYFPQKTSPTLFFYPDAPHPLAQHYLCQISVGTPPSASLTQRLQSAIRRSIAASAPQSKRMLLRGAIHVVGMTVSRPERCRMQLFVRRDPWGQFDHVRTAAVQRRWDGDGKSRPRRNRQRCRHRAVLQVRHQYLDSVTTGADISLLHPTKSGRAPIEKTITN